jgi:predicted DsbA family dithiol-disulfide isomerase
VRIDVWSDVVCPWCSIGKKRLERAVAEFAHGDDVEVVYHSYLLDPSAPAKATGTAQEMLQRKYRLTPEQAAEAQERVIRLAAEEGMDWSRHHDSPHVGTTEAHRLLHLALAEGGPRQQAALNDALLQAYFGDAADVADHRVLREIAVATGLDAARVDEVLTTDEYADAVATDIAQAQAFGATGVPFFVVDDRYGISGAQPTDLFRQALERAWNDTHPALQTIPGAAGADADVCGPDGCAI